MISEKRLETSYKRFKPLVHVLVLLGLFSLFLAPATAQEATSVEAGATPDKFWGIPWKLDVYVWEKVALVGKNPSEKVVKIKEYSDEREAEYLLMVKQGKVKAAVKSVEKQKEHDRERHEAIVKVSDAQEKLKFNLELKEDMTARDVAVEKLNKLLDSESFPEEGKQGLRTALTMLQTDARKIKVEVEEDAEELEANVKIKYGEDVVEKIKVKVKEEREKEDEEFREELESIQEAHEVRGKMREKIFNAIEAETGINAKDAYENLQKGEINTEDVDKAVSYINSLGYNLSVLNNRDACVGIDNGDTVCFSVTNDTFKQGLIDAEADFSSTLTPRDIEEYLRKAEEGQVSTTYILREVAKHGGVDAMRLAKDLLDENLKNLHSKATN